MCREMRENEMKWRKGLTKLEEQGKEWYREKGLRPEGKTTEQQEGHQEGRGEDKQEVKHILDL